MVFHPRQHLVDLRDLPGARGVAAIEQQAVGFVEHEHRVRLARFLEGAGDLALGLAEIGAENVGGALLDEFEPEAAREMARERGFARARRP